MTVLFIIYFLHNYHLDVFPYCFQAGEGKQVQGVLYNPHVPLVDWNLILIWVMAVGTVAIGGYWCGVTAYRQ